MSPLAFAFGAGLLAPLNPCGFAMLPAFLGYYVGNGAERSGGSTLSRLTQGFGAGAAVSAGFVGAFAFAAGLVSLGLRSLIRYVPWAALVIGVVLVVLGILLVAGKKVAVRPIQRLRPGGGRGYGSMAVFGAAYAVASLSCTLGVLLVVVAQALASRHPAGFLGVLLAYAAGAATVLTAVSLSTALAEGALARRLRRVLPLVERLGGGLLAVSGLYLVAYWLPVVAGSADSPLPASPVGRFAETLSRRLADFLDANRMIFALLAGVLALGAVVLVATRRRNKGGQHWPTCCERASVEKAEASEDARARS